MVPRAYPSAPRAGWYRPTTRGLVAAGPMGDAMAGGVVFDIDGTLIDNSAFHTIAWLRACRDFDLDFSSAELQRLLGMGGDRFMQALLGKEMPELDEAHGKYMAEFEPESWAFPGGAELLTELGRRGLHLGGGDLGRRRLADQGATPALFRSLVVSDSGHGRRRSKYQPCAGPRRYRLAALGAGTSRRVPGRRYRLGQPRRQPLRGLIHWRPDWGMVGERAAGCWRGRCVREREQAWPRKTPLDWL